MSRASKARFWIAALGAALVAALAAGAHAGEPAPRARRAWDFETPAPGGGDLYAAEEVPVQIDDRPSQPDWTQLFGAAADPRHPDRFPRQTPALLSSRQARGGRRSLLLESAGDHLLVRSARAPVRPGERIRIGGWIRSRGLESGSVRLTGRFLAAGGEIPGTAVSSEPVRGGGDWSPALALEAEAPGGAEDLVLEIRLEGSPDDRSARVWIDDLAVEIFRACRISWPGRRDLMARAGEPLAIAIECPDLDPGSYRVRIRVIAAGPGTGTGAAPRPVLEFEAPRLAPPGEPLRFLDDLGARLAGDGNAAGPPPGLYRVRVEVLSAEGSAGASALAAGESPLAWLGELPRGARRAGEYAFDAGAETILYRDPAGSGTLALRSRSGETLPVVIPAGEPLQARDLLGRRVAVEVLADGRSCRLEVGEVPVFIEEFPSVKFGMPSGNPSPR